MTCPTHLSEAVAHLGDVQRLARPAGLGQHAQHVLVPEVPVGGVDLLDVGEQLLCTDVGEDAAVLQVTQARQEQLPDTQPPAG